MPTLRKWKSPRKDTRVENIWKARRAANSGLTSWEEYQAEWNFIETEYGERPSNNGLDMANPAFAFTTNLARYIVQEQVGRLLP